MSKDFIHIAALIILHISISVAPQGLRVGSRQEKEA